MNYLYNLLEKVNKKIRENSTLYNFLILDKERGDKYLKKFNKLSRDKLIERIDILNNKRDSYLKLIRENGIN